MIYRLLSYVFYGAGLVLLGLAGYFCFAPEPALCLEVAQADMEIADCVPGKKIPVVFHFNNSSTRPIRILGLVMC